MSIGKKVLIGIGIYLLAGIVVAAIILTLDDKKNTAKTEAEAQARIDEMNAIYESHDPEVFLGYAHSAAKKQNRIDIRSVQPDVYTCIVEAGISGYEYSMTDDGADADGMVSAACLFALDCAKEIFTADEHIEQVSFYFRVKYKIDIWLESAVSLSVYRDGFDKINYDDFRIRVQNDYNEMAAVVDFVQFGGDIENRLKKLSNNFRASAVRNNQLRWKK